MVLDTALLTTQQYKVGIEGKVEQSREGVAPSPTSRCSSYWKGSLLVTLNYGRQLCFYYIYMHIDIPVWIPGDAVWALITLEKLWIQLFSHHLSTFFWKHGKEKKNSKSKPVKIRLKIDLWWHLSNSERSVYIYIYI